MAMDAISAAKSFATLHHVIRKGQLYGNLPHTHHLQRVEEVLLSFGERREHVRVAAWLHDIIEDTDVKYRDVEENFGVPVATLVQAVTSEDGLNRRVRNALTYPKIRKVGPDAVRLKLADRFANVTHGGGSATMYAMEYGEFRHGLYDPGDGMNAGLWLALDREIDIVDGGPARWALRP